MELQPDVVLVLSHELLKKTIQVNLKIILLKFVKKLPGTGYGLATGTCLNTGTGWCLITGTGTPTLSVING